VVHKSGREHGGPDHPDRRLSVSTRYQLGMRSRQASRTDRMVASGHEAGVSRIASIGTTVPEAKLSSRVLTFAAGSATTREVTVTNRETPNSRSLAGALVGPDQAAFRLANDDCIGHRLAVQSSCHIGVALTPGLQPGIRAARLAITTTLPPALSRFRSWHSSRIASCLCSRRPTDRPGGFLSLRDGVVTVDPERRLCPGRLAVTLADESRPLWPAAGDI